MLAGQGPRAIAVMWVMVFLSFIFVPLRLYTRICIISSLGWDDHIFNLAWVCLLLYTIFCHIAGTYGFGQSITALELDDAVKAIYMEMIGQTFAVLGMAIAKVSVGIFLLRIVVKRWHRVSIWTAMISLCVVSMMCAIIFWVQRLPSHSIYDPRVPGRNVVGVTPFAVLLGAWCAAVDFYFAIFPWLFIWKLNMKYKDKLTIAISMSLGFLAGICGIIRTIDLAGLASANYTEATVDLIIWSAVEMAVTLICVGIPTVRPLYRKIVHGSSFKQSEEGYQAYDSGKKTISRISLKKLGRRSGTHHPTTTTDDHNYSFHGDNANSYVAHSTEMDEEALVADAQNENHRYLDRIQVLEEVRVERA